MFEEVEALQLADPHPHQCDCVTVGPTYLRDTFWFFIFLWQLSSSCTFHILTITSEGMTVNCEYVKCLLLAKLLWQLINTTSRKKERKKETNKRTTFLNILLPKNKMLIASFCAQYVKCPEGGKCKLWLLALVTFYLWAVVEVTNVYCCTVSPIADFWLSLFMMFALKCVHTPNANTTQTFETLSLTGWGSDSSSFSFEIASPFNFSLSTKPASYWAWFIKQWSVKCSQQIQTFS